MYLTHVFWINIFFKEIQIIISEIELLFIDIFSSFIWDSVIFRTTPSRLLFYVQSQKEKGSPFDIELQEDHLNVVNGEGSVASSQTSVDCARRRPGGILWRGTRHVSSRCFTPLATPSLRVAAHLLTPLSPNYRDKKIILGYLGHQESCLVPGSSNSLIMFAQPPHHPLSPRPLNGKLSRNDRLHSGRIGVNCSLRTN